VSSLLASIPPPPAPGLQLGPLDLRLYGLLIAIGAYAALRLAASRYEKLGGDPELAERALLVGLVCGLLGARVGYVLPRLGDFATRPLDAFAIWQGGLTIFGGLVFGALGAIVYLRRKQMDLPAMLTAVAPALPLAQAIGRWGNYFNQELYGRPTELPWALEVEPGYRRPGYEAFSTFHPTFLYESLWNLALVGVLLWIDRRGKLKRGSLIFVYVIGYGVGRAWIEALRIDTDARILGLSRNNWNALFFIVLGAVGLWWWERRREVGEGPSSEEEGGPADAAAVHEAGDADDGADAATLHEAGAEDDGEEPAAGTEAGAADEAVVDVAEAGDEPLDEAATSDPRAPEHPGAEAPRGEDPA
jgi:prolipoprotein diacylglyceryl transferase